MARKHALWLWLLAAGCMGDVMGGPGSDPGEGGGGGVVAGSGGGGVGAGGTGGDPVPVGFKCDGLNVGFTPIRALYQVEYNNTVADLLGDTTHPADSFPDDQGAAAVTQIGMLHLQRYMAAAEKMANTAVAANLNQLLGCDPAGGERPCTEQFIRRFGQRAYRRPLEADEVTQLLGLFSENRLAATFPETISLVVQAMLISPNFLYHIYVGQPMPGTPFAKLTSYEVADRLAYLFTRSMPDEGLFAAAAAGALGDRKNVLAQARRLLADPKQAQRARDAMGDSYWRWLGLDGLHDATKTVGGFTTDVLNQMGMETRRFLDHVTWEGDGKLETILTAPVTFANATLARMVYANTPVTGTDFQKIDLNPAQRAGLLTQPSLMSLLSEPNQTHPVFRGKFVRERLLCNVIPDPPAPPPGVEIKPPEVRPGVSTRQRWEEHASNPCAAACHALMEPIGFGFEHYDQVGRWRTRDAGFEVDSRGTITQTDDLNGTFDGVPDLARRLGGSKQVRQCVSTFWFRLAFDRPEGDEDRCSVALLNQSFETGHSMRELVVALSQTDAFMYRRTGR